MYASCRRLQKTWGPDVIQSLIKSQPSLAEEDNLAIFKRKWEYMYIYAEIGYARGYTGLHHFTFVRQVSLVVRVYFCYHR
jgi:cyclopropane-fatty-acyl-phospholipid synthase